jgi:hypothetical protein
MNSVRLLLSISIALSLCACPDTHQRIGYHQIPVSWHPGYENVPDCNPLIAVQGKTLNIKGVNVTTPMGVGVGGGELTREDKALQVASDAALQADQKYTHLCELLPSYAHDQQAFYRARDQMFDLIKGTDQVASAVAAQTGQTPPAQPPAVPTAASDAAAGAGINPAKGIANVPATAASGSSAATSPSPSSSNAGNQGLAKVTSAADHLKQVAAKKAPGKVLSKKKHSGSSTQEQGTSG